MKTLVVYFSRTGTTRALAEQIAYACSADMEAIQESGDRLGAMGYLRSLTEVLGQREVPIRPSELDPAQYDLVVLGTPIWAWNMASPVRSYLVRHRGLMRRLALFCTYGGGGEAKVFSDMQTVCDQHALARLAVRSQDFQQGNYQPELARFLDVLKSADPASPLHRDPNSSMATSARL